MNRAEMENQWNNNGGRTQAVKVQGRSLRKWHRFYLGFKNKIIDNDFT